MLTTTNTHWHCISFLISYWHEGRLKGKALPCPLNRKPSCESNNCMTVQAAGPCELWRTTIHINRLRISHSHPSFLPWTVTARDCSSVALTGRAWCAFLPACCWSITAPIFWCTFLRLRVSDSEWRVDTRQEQESCTGHETRAREPHQFLGLFALAFSD